MHDMNPLAAAAVLGVAVVAVWAPAVIIFLFKRGANKLEIKAFGMTVIVEGRREA